MPRERRYVIFFGLFLLCVYGMARWLDRDVPFYACWLGACVFSFLAYQSRRVMCPHCRRFVHQYWQRFTYCPYCGEPLDGEP